MKRYFSKKFWTAFTFTVIVTALFAASSGLVIDGSGVCKQMVNFQSQVSIYGAEVATKAYVMDNAVAGASNLIDLDDVTATTPSSVADNLKPIVPYFTTDDGGIDANTVTILHMDGDNDSTTITDSALTPHTYTVAADAKLKTAVKKYGTASAYFDGTGDYISAPDADAWRLGGGTGDFTIDGYFNVDAFSASSRGIMMQYADTSNLWVVFVYSSYINFTVRDKSETATTSVTVTSITISEDTWYHVAVVRKSGVISIYLNGVKQTLDENTNPGASMPNIAGELRIGSGWAGNMNGYIDEARISNIARWSGAFTPRASAYAESTNVTDFRPTQTASYTGWHRYPATFARTDDDTIVVGDNDTNAEMFKVGRPIRYADTVGTWRYGIVTAYSSGTIDLAGGALTTDFDTYIEVGDMSKAVNVELFVSGTYGNAIDTDLLYNDMNTKFLWRLGKAYCVAFSGMHKTVDTGAEPKVGVRVNAQSVSTNDTNKGIQLTTAGAWVDNPSTAINTAYYAISRGQYLTVECPEAGGTGDAADLTVSATFIIE